MTFTRRQFCVQATTALGAVGLSSLSIADEKRRIEINSPLSHQIFQREDYVPARAYENVPGGPQLGRASLLLRGEAQGLAGSTIEFRIVALTDAFGKGTDWTPLKVEWKEDRFQSSVDVAAGGWYRLELRIRDGGGVALASGHVEPIGVGEVFVIAGQSYAAGANDELQKVEDPAGRVTAFDVRQRTWRIANDPQPNVGDGGTIWPAFANLLLPILRVPIGLINVAVGGTSSRQWLPGTPLFDGLVIAGQVPGRFRCVLWQQGESDVIEGVDTATYVRNLMTIRESSAREWGFERPWLLAKSTLHPTVYKKPKEEEAIREAINELCRTRPFVAGPDTDILGGENRGDMKTRRHFSPIGQRRAALLWFAAVMQTLATGNQ